MGPEDVRLNVADDGEGTYAFACPRCREDVEKAADRKIVELLVSAGVPVGAAAAVRGRAEAATLTPSLPEQGRALTLDDLIEFHYALQDDEAIHRFLSPS